MTMFYIQNTSLGGVVTILLNIERVCYLLRNHILESMGG